MTNLVATSIVTAYCACSSCCGPQASGITASGVRPIEGRTVAANHLPFGARVHIAGVGWRTVEDRLSRRYTGRLDVYYRSHAEARRFGIQRRAITLRPSRRGLKN